MYIRYCAAAVLALGCFFAARRFLADCAAERYKNAFFSKLAAGLCFVAWMKCCVMQRDCLSRWRKTRYNAWP